MLTETVLNDLYFSKAIDTIFLSPKEYKEAEKVFFIFEQYVKEHEIFFVRKEIDHYVVTQPSRMIEGIPPLSPIEFAYFVLCSTLIFFDKPKWQLSFDYAKEICSRVQSFPALTALEEIPFLQTNPIIKDSDVSKQKKDRKACPN